MTPSSLRASCRLLRKLLTVLCYSFGWVPHLYDTVSVWLFRHLSEHKHSKPQSVPDPVDIIMKSAIEYEALDCLCLLWVTVCCLYYWDTSRVVAGHFPGFRGSWGPIAFGFKEGCKPIFKSLKRQNESFSLPGNGGGAASPQSACPCPVKPIAHDNLA